MSPTLPGRRRILRRVLVLVLLAIFVLYLVLPAALGIFAVLPLREEVGAPPEGFREVTLTSDDGIVLEAWYAPPDNGAAIVLIHGAGASREAVRPYAAMLARHGYGVLALDLAGHGGSGGPTNRFGWGGTRDVGAAVEFLEAQEGVDAIGGMGLSLGGEVLLGAASEYPQVRAIVADGATQRSVEELHALESERPLYRSFTARVLYGVVQIASGTAPPEPLLDSMAAAESTGFLLIAGGNVPQEVAFNEVFTRTAGERAQLWVAPDAGHTGAFGRHPAGYEERVIAFFDTALLSGPGEEEATGTGSA
ncbi:alpha/beta fold hydrolase [Methanoculleus sp. Wushi-C6]|uniref:Alpha/beta fold hydrolase n=1 Tax=Methanoculleus caldifontis TaxID=2651577 RepID=A0ABU3X1E1_9EURY|nr:alpha/beta fold hydrolase [Methanoculleus sp. Wushi-C6]MDV2481852.1 alpha/beta fold hydrolase [Methanoculleus sp. Wushi-C6]